MYIMVFSSLLWHCLHRLEPPKSLRHLLQRLGVLKPLRHRLQFSNALQPQGLFI